FAGLLTTQASSPGAAVIEYTRDGTNADVADKSTKRELFSWHQDGFNSLGGTLAFGPDGMLWFASGDAERTPSDSPDLTSPLGKMFRIDAATGNAAPNNLSGKIWDYGLRNPYRLSFDRVTHDLY